MIRTTCLLALLLLCVTNCGGKGANLSAAGESCVNDGDCVDGLYCIVGTCTDVVSIQCVNNSDCPTAFCKNGSCSPPIECDQSLPCPKGARCDVSGICLPETLQSCTVDGHCDDDQRCTNDYCSNGWCKNDKIPNCCAKASDCDDGDEGTADMCVEFQCYHENQDIITVDTPPPPECVKNADCNDEDVCTTDKCTDGSCVNDFIGGCCNEDSECNDGDPDTDDSCVDNACKHVQNNLECTENNHCGDGDNCTIDKCVLNKCVHTPSVDPFCCNEDTKCNDQNPLTTDKCVDGSCKNTPLSCSDSIECNDLNACTADSCVANSCLNKLQLTDACRCTSNVDCVGKGGVCTVVNNSTTFGTYCITPVGPKQGAATCTKDAECRSGFCMSFDDNTTMCFQACKTDQHCPNNEMCGTVVFTVDSKKTEIGACMASPNVCGGDKDCLAGEMCVAVEDEAKPGTISGVCGKADGTKKTAGSTCSTDAECQSGICTEPIGKTQKICWSLCVDNEDCAAGLSCYPGILYFVFDQGTVSTVDDTLYSPGSCLPYAGTYAKCSGDSDCPANEFCNFGKNQTSTALEPRCLLPWTAGTGKGGSACANNAQCRSGYCINAQYGNGFCLGLCKSNLECVNGTTCQKEAIFVLNDKGNEDPADDIMAEWTLCEP